MELDRRIPDITAGKVQLYMFVTRDGGATYRGALLADYDSSEVKYGSDNKNGS